MELLGLEGNQWIHVGGFSTMNEVKDRFLGAISSKPRTELRGSGRCIYQEVSLEEKVKKDKAKGGIVRMHSKVHLASDSLSIAN